jgi:hypothetical protein
MLNEEKKKTPKIIDILDKIKECLNSGRYRFSLHALDRKKGRLFRDNYDCQSTTIIVAGPRQLSLPVCDNYDCRK